MHPTSVTLLMLIYSVIVILALRFYLRTTDEPDAPRVRGLSRDVAVAGMALAWPVMLVATAVLIVVNTVRDKPL
jgi:hypothetical protein